MRILIAEDSVTMRRVMQMTFAGENVELLEVDSGELALERGRDFMPDVAFVDASLPGMDGYDLTRAIKADPQLAGVPVILMASQHRPFDNSRGASVGVDDHIVKPFDSQEAIDKAHRFAGALPVEEVASAAVTGRPTPPPSDAPPVPQVRRAPPPLPVGQPIAQSARPMAPTPVAHAAISVAPEPQPAVSAPSAPAASVAEPSSAPGANGNAMSDSVVARLAALGLTQEQVEGVLRISAEVVERVVWEVVPELAEAMIREELHRLTGD